MAKTTKAQQKPAGRRLSARQEADLLHEHLTQKWIPWRVYQVRMANDGTTAWEVVAHLPGSLRDPVEVVFRGIDQGRAHAVAQALQHYDSHAAQPMQSFYAVLPPVTRRPGGEG
jgi:hypothetical protein